MSESRLAVVADDPALAGALEAQAHKALGRPAFGCPFEAVRDHLGHDTDGLLVFGAASASDCETVTRLVQEIHLQKFPPVVALVAAGAAVHDRLASLEPYVSRRLCWPEDQTALRQLFKEPPGRGRPFARESGEPAADRLRRRLQALTPSLEPLAERLALAAAHDVTVLLTGETGSGKTHLARLLHEFSPRRSHRFLAVPCGALAANLVESEFFGHVKGAFTGADRPKVGKFEAVGPGTLLLDEIDTLPLEQQATLLRVIETGEFEPVGGTETRTCAARLVVASNLNLEEAVERGRFRQDLYYRLNVMSFHLPPLRERVRDIAPLVRGMAARFARKFGKDLFDIGPAALGVLEAFNWPGNLRQLENVIQQAVLMCPGPELLPEHLPEHVRDYATLSPANGHAKGNGGGASLLHNRELIERNIIARVLVNSGYSRARAADALGISRVTLYKKMKKYGLMNVAAPSA